MPKTEEVDLVDGEDRIIGSASLGECLDRGLLHRAVAVMVSRSDGRLILQQRSRKDRWHPGLWTLSCTGHVKKGETYEGAAARELEEEIGMRAELAFVTKRQIPTLRQGRLTEREWVSLFAAVSDAAVMVDPVELEGVKELTRQELEGMLGGGSLTPDSVILLADYARFIDGGQPQGV